MSVSGSWSSMALFAPCCCSSTSARFSFRNSSSQRCNFVRYRQFLRLKAAVTVESPASSATDAGGLPKLLLKVKELSAVVTESRQSILKGVNLTIHEGEVNYTIIHFYAWMVQFFPS